MGKWSGPRGLRDGGRRLLPALAVLCWGFPGGLVAAGDKLPSKRAAVKLADAGEVGAEAERTPTAPAKAPAIDLQGRGIIDKTPMPTRQQNPDEYNAYCDALLSAGGSTAKAFANSVNPELTYVQAYEETHVYRGQVMHVQGRLIRVLHLQAPNLLWDSGVKWEYEGWILHEKCLNGNPVCVIFAELPPGIKVGEDLNYRVSFDGYLFKRYAYQDGRGDWRNCPLLIGHAPVVLRSAGGGHAWSAQTVVTTIGLLLGIPLGVVALLTWWYRRSDRRVQSRLAVARTATFVEPPAEDAKPEDPGTA